MAVEVRRFKDLEALSEAAAGFIGQRALKGVAEKGFFTLVLSGGNTPRRLYERLAQPPFLTDLPWTTIHFFWGDERFVPPDHRDSNFAMVHETLLSRIPVSRENVHPINTKAESGMTTAKEYAEDLRHFFQMRSTSDSFLQVKLATDSPPSFDLLLLGLGRDGHTASLFPGDPALEEEKHWTAWVPNPGQPPPHPRVTLTLPIINQAAEVLFLVSGSEKKAIVEDILHGSPVAEKRYPAARVGAKNHTYWFTA
jgi:6-phosphogluconolactonase